MNLEDKKTYALQFIRLGIEPYIAMRQSGFTEEEITNSESDPEFVMEVDFEQAQEEIKLLEKLNTAMDIAIQNGNASAVRWKLERLNKKWRPSSNMNFPDTPGKGIPVNIVMTTPEDHVDSDK